MLPIAAIEGTGGIAGVDTVITTLTNAVNFCYRYHHPYRNEILMIGIGKIVLGFAISAVLTMVGMRRKRR